LLPPAGTDRLFDVEEQRHQAERVQSTAPSVKSGLLDAAQLVARFAQLIGTRVFAGSEEIGVVSDVSLNEQGQIDKIRVRTASPLGFGERIVEIHVESLAARLGMRDVRLTLSDEAKSFLAKESVKAGSGARYVARTVSRHVSTPLSTSILRGELNTGGTAVVTLPEGMLVIRST